MDRDPNIPTRLRQLAFTDAELEFVAKLFHRLRAVPPNSRFSFHAVTNGKGEIHNTRVELSEDQGPLVLS